MHTYAISDVHGNYEKYTRILAAIDLQAQDLLYVLGDVIDRGPDGIKILQDMIRRPNVIPILGNHEFMMAICLRFLMREVEEESIARLSGTDLAAFQDWQVNGGAPTLRQFSALKMEERLQIQEYLGEFSLYEEARVGNHGYVLLHAGLAHFSPDKPLEEYSLEDFMEGAPDYATQYWPDRYLISGHTPTRLIPGNPCPDRIYRANHHIAIDCGCGFGGSLGAFCLDTGEEFYV